MAKTGKQYGDQVRALRAAGHNFPASRGYLLASPSSWSSGQKAAVSRAFNANARSLSALQGWETRRANIAAEAAPAEAEPEGGLTESEIEGYWDDGAGDNFEEWDDIEYFDESEADELMDEEADDYEEDT